MSAEGEVPAMPSVPGFFPEAPGCGIIGNMADVGRRAMFYDQLQGAKARGLHPNITESVIGEAFCVVSLAASKQNGKQNGRGEAATTATLEAFQQDLTTMKEDMAKMKDDMAKMKDGMAKMKDDMATKEDMTTMKLTMASMSDTMKGVKTQMENNVHRNWNRISRHGDHPLQPLMAETGANMGEYPPADIFPATLEDVVGLKAAALDRLEDFYGRTFKGQSASARQVIFKCFIGAK